MQKQFYFLSPVEVVKVTPKNLEEAAEWCGGEVATAESRRVPGRMDKYVWVPTPKGTAISWAFPGMFITKRLVRTVKNDLRATFAVYRRDYFEKNYFETPKHAVDETWEIQFAKDAKELEKEIKVFAEKVNAERADKIRDITTEEKEAFGKVSLTPEEVERICDVAGLEYNKEIAEAMDRGTDMGEIKRIYDKQKLGVHPEDLNPMVEALEEIKKNDPILFAAVTKDAFRDSQFIQK